MEKIQTGLEVVIWYLLKSNMTVSAAALCQSLSTEQRVCVSSSNQSIAALSPAVFLFSNYFTDILVILTC